VLTIFRAIGSVALLSDPVANSTSSRARPTLESQVLNTVFTQVFSPGYTQGSNVDGTQKRTQP
jgi:hypothetical protein